MSGLFPISDELKELARKREIDTRWEIAEIGQGFDIPLNQAKLTNLRTKASIMGKKLDRKFAVKQHEKCFEVGRIK